jgi:hypothetical protein
MPWSLRAPGMNIFDVAPLCGHGLAEHRWGTALRGVPRDGFLLSTKVGRWLDPLSYLSFAFSLFTRPRSKRPVGRSCRVESRAALAPRQISRIPALKPKREICEQANACADCLLTGKPEVTMGFGPRSSHP